MKQLIKHILLRLKFRSNNIKDYGSISLKSIIDGSTFNSEVMVAPFADVKQTVIGRLTSIGRYTKITNSVIGKYCAISWDVTINAISHPYKNLSISAFPYVPYVGNFVTKRKQTYNKVVIKNDVWIGANSVIMPGVTIGNGAIIGAGSVVTKDVPDYAIVGGVPAKLIKYRFSEELIKELLAMEWWNWDKKFIKENISFFQNEITIETLNKLKKIATN